MSGPQNSRRIAMVALLVALAGVLDFPVFGVPDPFAGFLTYEFWEVPIVVALLLLGVRGGVLVAVVNSMILFVVNPGALISGPFYNLAAELATFLGLLGAMRLSRRFGWSRTALAGSAALAGATVRTAAMTALNWAIIPLSPPLGFSIPSGQVPPLLLPIAFFNFTLVLYTVPLAYSVMSAVSARVRVQAGPA
jgi:riboflavin transporter FmnP